MMMMKWLLLAVLVLAILAGVATQFAFARVTRGSDATVIMRHVPCRADEMEQPGYVTRITNRDFDDSQNIWNNLRYKSWSKHLAQPMVDLHGAVVSCDVTDLQVTDDERASMERQQRAAMARLTKDEQAKTKPPIRATYMQRLPGYSLHEYIIRQNGVANARVAIVKAITSLGFLHDAGVAHTDPWFGNFIVNNNMVRVIDWMDGVTLNDRDMPSNYVKHFADFAEVSAYAPGIMKKYILAHPTAQTMLKLDVLIFARSLIATMTTWVENKSDKPEVVAYANSVMDALRALQPHIFDGYNIRINSFAAHDIIVRNDVDKETMFRLIQDPDAVPKNVWRLLPLVHGQRIGKLARKLSDSFAY